MALPCPAGGLSPLLRGSRWADNIQGQVPALPSPCPQPSLGAPVAPPWRGRTSNLPPGSWVALGQEGSPRLGEFLGISSKEQGGGDPGTGRAKGCFCRHAGLGWIGLVSQRDNPRRGRRAEG